MTHRIVISAAVILGVLFLGSGGIAGPPKSKTDRKFALQPHPQPNQDSMDITGKHSDRDITVREWDGSMSVEAMLGYSGDSERIVNLLLGIENRPNEVPPPPSQLFVPSTILVVLPNGHTYRPFNQADVIQQAVAMESGSLSNTYSGYNPPPVTHYDTNCSLNADTATCRTTADQSAQAGYAVGFALGAAIRNAFAKQKAEKYIQEVKKQYLVSQQVPLGGTVIGYVNLYVEDIHSGPFTVRVPAGDKTYDFVFGPEDIEVPKEK
jgi:hypothetical protein